MKRIIFICTIALLLILICCLTSENIDSSSIINPEESLWMDYTLSELIKKDGYIRESGNHLTDISGNHAIIGAIERDTENSPMAYIFFYNGIEWVLKQELFPAGETIKSQTFSVSIFGDYAIVGADQWPPNKNGAVYIFVRQGDIWIQQAKLEPDEKSFNESFGETVSISGDYAVIGSKKKYRCGIAYVFHRKGTTWNQEQILIVSHAPDDGDFGSLIKILGHRIIISAPAIKSETTPEIVYVYRRNGIRWDLEQKLIPGDTNDKIGFGQSIATAKDYIFIGSHVTGYIEEVTGAVYIYHLDGKGWQNVQKITPLEDEKTGYFSFGLSASGNYLFVGDPMDDANGPSTGSVYIYYNNGTEWIRKNKVTLKDNNKENLFGLYISTGQNYSLTSSFSPDISIGKVYMLPSSAGPIPPVVTESPTPMPTETPSPRPTAAPTPVTTRIVPETLWSKVTKITTHKKEDKFIFGNNISISQNLTLNGSAYANEKGDLTGAVFTYFHDKKQWTIGPTLYFTKGKFIYGFGDSVQISGDYAIISAIQDKNIGKNTGAAFIFHYNGSEWIEKQMLTTAENEANDYYGESIGISGDWAIVGAPGDDDYGWDAGAAYLFKRMPGSWKEYQKIKPPDGEEDDSFGNLVAISGEYTAVLGSHIKRDNSPYLFHFTGSKWEMIQRLRSADFNEDWPYFWEIHLYVR